MLSAILFCLVMFFPHFAFALLQTPQMPVNVDAMFPTSSNTSETLVLTGTIEAKQHAQLAPLVPGRVAKIAVEVGDIVSQNQVLLSLDASLAKLEVQAMQANVEALQINQAEANRLLSEAITLSEQQVVAKTLISERRALVASANAQLSRSQAQLSLQQELLTRHTLRAPFDGVIAQRNTDVGEWVSQQAPVLTLVAQKDLRLSIAIPQEYYRQLANQQNVAVKVYLDAANNDYTPASISRFVPVSDVVTRTFMALIDLPASINAVVGMSAKAQIQMPNTQGSSIILPRSAVKQHPDGGSSVFVVENGTAKRVITSYSSLANNMVAIANQPADMAYILTGVELLQNGTPVKVNIVKDGR
jgi:RND family efflux transporter MFP subunit